MTAIRPIASLFAAFALLAAAPLAVYAQADGASKATSKKTTGKKAATRSSSKSAAEKKPAVEADANIKLSDADMDVAKRVHTGTIACELGASVTVTPDDKRPGFFTVRTKSASFHMHPVEARTGALRLEDQRAGALWIQLGNKSMLMSQKLGQRLADECMSPEQLALADELKKNPMPGLLDAPKSAAVAMPAVANSMPAASASR
jgi:hypothetical protein